MELRAVIVIIPDTRDAVKAIEWAAQDAGGSVLCHEECGWELGEITKKINAAEKDR